MIKAIMFDLDGTLISQRNASSIVLNQFYIDNKYRFSNLEQKEFFDRWSKTGRKNFQEFLKGEITFEEKMVTQILEFFERLDNKIDKKQAKEIFDKFLPIYEENMLLYDDVIPCLEFLKRSNYQLGVITNGHSKDQRNKLRRFDLERYLPIIIISGDIGVAKPNAKIFFECINNLELAPQEIIYIGDTPEMDVVGANKVGMKGVWLNRESEQNKYNTISINNLNKLKTLLA
jgi:putative hydrolase of the HAD superfamily